MKKLRLAIKKEGALQFLSHLDFARVVRLVIVRAKLPVCYSEGFNPHMKISFASALGVGVSAAVEYMDMDLTEEVPLEDVRKAMNSTSPEGFAVLDGRYVDEKAPKLMAMANYAVYDLQGPAQEALSQEELQHRLDSFNAAEEVIFEKSSPKSRRTKTVDMKKHVIENVTGRVEGKRLILTAGILQTEEGAVKPIEVWQILCRQFGLPAMEDQMLAHRTGIYVRREGTNYSLLADKDN